MIKKAHFKRSKKFHPDEENDSHLPAGIGKKKSKYGLFVVFLLTLIFILGVVLRLINFSNIPQRSPDEAVYTYQAKIITQKGPVEGIRASVRIYNTNKNNWLYPPPTRIGYLWIVAAMMKATNLMDERAGALVSYFFSIITLMLLIVLGLRFFNRWITLYALLFMSVSPMSLAIARRSWQESMLACAGLFLIYCCCEITRANSDNKLTWPLIFIATGSYCILVKSTGAIIYAICMIWVFWVLFIRKKHFSKGFLMIILGVVGAGISLFCLIYAASGISPLLEVLTHFKYGVETSAYARDYASGPWYHFFKMLWMLTPVNTILCFIGMAGAIFLLYGNYTKVLKLAIGKNTVSLFGIIFFMITFMTVLFLAKEHSLNLRYASVLNVPFYFMSGLGFYFIILFVKKMFKNSSFFIIVGTIILAIGITAVSDYQNFTKIIVKPGIKDLSIRLLRESSQLKSRW